MEVEFDTSDTVGIDQDTRKAYPKTRFVAVGLLGSRLHVLCLTPADGGIRVISFRKANTREVKDYDQTRTITDKDGKVRELTAADLRRFKPAAEVLPAELLKVMGVRPRGPQKAPTKQATTIRLSPDVMAAFKATGTGWQTRIDAALKDWLQTHSPI